jgi:hypothetical protein
MSETVTWSSRASFRPLIVAAVAAGGLGLVAMTQVGSLFQALINATHESYYWSDGMISGIYNGSRIAVFLPLLYVLWLMLVNLSVRYEIKDGRFLFHHGVLIRKHDQILLQRVRDFRVYRSLVHMILGVGKIHIVSRDETFPELTVGPFGAPLEVEKMLHEAVSAQKESTGYRELETY